MVFWYPMNVHEYALRHTFFLLCISDEKSTNDIFDIQWMYMVMHKVQIVSNEKKCD